MKARREVFLIGLLLFAAMAGVSGQAFFETPWAYDWKYTPPDYWKELDVPIRAIPPDSKKLVGMHLIGDTSVVLSDYTATTTGDLLGTLWWGSLNISYMNIRKEWSGPQQQRHLRKVQDLNGQVQDAIIGLSLAAADGSVDLSTREKREYFAGIIEAAGLLRASMQAYEWGFEAYIMNNGYVDIGGTMSRGDSAISFVYKHLAVAPGGMLGYVIYAFDNSATASELRRQPLMWDLYDAYDSFLGLLEETGFYVRDLDKFRGRQMKTLAGGNTPPDLITFGAEGFPFK